LALVVYHDQRAVRNHADGPLFFCFGVGEMELVFKGTLQQLISVVETLIQLRTQEGWLIRGQDTPLSISKVDDDLVVIRILRFQSPGWGKVVAQVTRDKDVLLTVTPMDEQWANYPFQDGWAMLYSELLRLRWIDPLPAASGAGRGEGQDSGESGGADTGQADPKRINMLIKQHDYLKAWAENEGVLDTSQGDRQGTDESSELDRLISLIQTKGLGWRPEKDIERAAAWLAWKTTPKQKKPKLGTWLGEKFGIDAHGNNNVSDENFHNYKRKVPRDRLSALKGN